MGATRPRRRHREHQTGERLHPRAIAWLCVLAACTMLPFSGYHLYQGEWLMGMVAAIPGLLAIAVITTVLSRGGISYATLLLGTLVGNLCVLFVVFHGGVGTVYWAFPAIVFNFGIAGTRAGLVLSTAVVVGILLITVTAVPQLTLFRMTIALVLSIAVAFVLSWNVGYQRRQLERLATFDPLTGAANRREMERSLEEAVSRRHRYDSPTTLILLDFDRFKRINDSEGHDVGDRVLQEFGEMVRKRLRISDRFFRYGGEEFVIVAPHTDSVAGMTLADDLRARVQMADYRTRHPVTISAGVATVRSDDTIETWLKRGDDALYQAKELGRNRCELG